MKKLHVLIPILEDIYSIEIIRTDIKNNTIMFFWKDFWWFEKRARVDRWFLIDLLKKWTQRKGFSILSGRQLNIDGYASYVNYGQISDESGINVYFDADFRAETEFDVVLLACAYIQNALNQKTN